VGARLTFLRRKIRGLVDRLAASGIATANASNFHDAILPVASAVLHPSAEAGSRPSIVSGNVQPGTFLNLRRVIRGEPQSDEEIRILALEIYEGCLAIRYALPSGLGEGPASAEEAGLNPMGLMSLTIRDDLGTPYGIYAGSAGWTFGGISYFTPAVPSDAAWLEVMTKAGVVRFDLAE
jgi:hypothetical protein